MWLMFQCIDKDISEVSRLAETPQITKPWQLTKWFFFVINKEKCHSSIKYAFVLSAGQKTVNKKKVT